MQDKKFSSKFALAAVATAAALFLVGCGGGGGTASDAGQSISTGTGSTGSTGNTGNTGSGGSTGGTGSETTPKTQVATEAAGPSPSLGASDCAALTAAFVAGPTISGADMQEVSDVLSSQDPTHAYEVFKRAPQEVMWWVRSGGRSVSLSGIGTGVHEATHSIDFTLSYSCFGDTLARYYGDGQILTSGTHRGDTANRSIVSSTLPPALQTSRALRYDLYITGSASQPTADFAALLEELNAYVGSAKVEVAVRSNPQLSYLYESNVAADENVGGTVDFMMFMQYYLQAARIGAPSTYSDISSQPATIAVMQSLWTRAEQILQAAYPHSTTATGGAGTVVPVDALTAIYSSPMLAELDSLGITHKTAADWSTTYFK